MNKWMDEKQYPPPVYSWRKLLCFFGLILFISGNLFFFFFLVIFLNTVLGPTQCFWKERANSSFMEEKQVM